jgi:hypothetical protein
MTRSVHAVWGPASIVTYYSVKRHSLQALLKMTADVSIHDTPDTPVIRGMSARFGGSQCELLRPGPS